MFFECNTEFALLIEFIDRAILQLGRDTDQLMDLCPVEI
jgi:hypothetical protein